LDVLIIDYCSPDQPALEQVKAQWPMVVWLTTPNNAGRLGVEEGHRL
jgi:hypothetical protein